MVSDPTPSVIADRAAASPKARTARTLAGMARTRVANGWPRLASCGVVALVALSVVGNLTPLMWFGGLILVVIVDRILFQRLGQACADGEPPARMWPLAGWALAQSGYTNAIAAMLWLAPYVHGETLAVIFLLASLANAAASLRSATMLAVAAVIPPISLLIMLPIADYLIGGARNWGDLVPLMGVVLFIGFGLSLWRSLQESDAAQARAELAALRERQSAAAAARAKSDTIQLMQDELRTPMAALIGAAEHLRRAAVSPEARAHIGALAQAGEVLRLVLEDLSQLDRLENGQVNIETAPCDPRELARSVAGAFRAAAHDKQLELFLDVAPDVPAQVELDAARVRQILFNLVANAIKFTSHGGVRLRLQAQPGEREGHVRLGFAVADTGAGMSRSQLAIVLGRRSEEAARGGLGLAISLRLARLMGGKIAGKSELGEGSVFSFVVEAPVVAVRSVA